MLSAKHAALTAKILLLSLAAALSFFAVTAWLPDSDFVRDSIESVEDSSNTVMKFSAATLSTSVAISALPEREATVIKLRYFHGLTQQRIAKVLDVSQVQVSRIEKKAIAQLRLLME